MPQRRRHLPPRKRTLPRGIEWRRGKFRITWRDASLRRRSETFPTLELAEAALTLRRAEAMRQRLGLDEASPTLSAFTETYLQWLRSNGRTNFPIWWRSNAHQIRRLTAVFGHLRLHEITPPRAEEYRRAEIERGRSPEAVRRDLVQLRAMLGYAEKWGVVHENPLRRLRLPRLWHRETVLPPREDLQAILEALPPRGREFCRFLAETGCRLNEALSLTWRDVDLARNVVRIRAEVAKSRRERTIPLSAEARRILEALRGSGSERVFPLTRSWLNVAWERACRRAGVSVRGRFHLFRHLFASRLIEAGVDLGVVRDLLGHATFSLLPIYVHAREERKAEAIARLDMEGNLWTR